MRDATARLTGISYHIQIETLQRQGTYQKQRALYAQRVTAKTHNWKFIPFNGDLKIWVSKMRSVWLRVGG